MVIRNLKNMLGKSGFDDILGDKNSQIFF